MMHRVLNIWVFAFAMITLMVIPAYAANESDEDSLIDSLGNGYIQVQEGTTAYDEVNGSEVGVFTNDEIIYAEAIDDTDNTLGGWYRVFYDTKDTIQTDEAYITFIKTNDCRALTEEEELLYFDSISNSENEFHYNNDYLIPMVNSFIESDKQDNETNGGEQAKESKGNEKTAAKSADAEKATSVQITTQPKNAATSVGHAVKFTVSATGTGLTYQWQSRADSSASWGNTTWSGNTTATLTVKPSSTSYKGRQFRCIVKDKYGAKVVSSTATLTNVVAAPAIKTQPKSAATSVGHAVKFMVSATGTGLTYQWQSRADSSASWGNTTWSGNTTATLTVKPSSTSYKGRQFRCIVKDKYGAKVVSSTATLSNVVAAPAIKTQPKSAATSVGHAVKFTVSATGTGLTYQWQSRADSSASWGNTTWSGNTTATLTVKPSSTSYKGRQFRCIVKDKYGAKVVSSTATLSNVVAAPAIKTQPKSAGTSVGHAVKFTVSATGTGLTYQWQSRASSSASWGNTTWSGNTTATLTVKPSSTTYNGRQFRCLVKDKYGSKVYSGAATLTVVAAPAIKTQPKSIVTSVGQTAKFTVSATGTGLTYQWQSRASSSASWGNTTWSGNTTATLTVKPSSTTYNGRQFRCLVKDKYGAKVYSGAATLTVVAAPRISAQTVTETTSVGQAVKFTVSATGTGLTYQWQSRASSSASWGNTTWTGNTTATLTVKPSSTTYNGRQFRCLVKDKYGAKVYSSAATLTVVAAPAIKTQPKSAGTSAGQAVKFTVSATGTGLTYQWQSRASSSASWGNTTWTGNTTATLTVKPSSTTYNGRQFRCVVKDRYGAKVYSSAATLTVVAAPAIKTQPTSASVTAGQNATFKVVATGTGLTYQWQSRASSSASWGNTTWTGNTTATLTVKPSSTTYNGRQFRCLVKDKYGAKVYSNAATLTVKAATKYRALAIGNDNYTAANPLRSCINDANGMGKMLKGLKNSFSVTTRYDQTASGMLSAIPTAFSGATSSDVSLFYYSGHGLDASDYYGTYRNDEQGALCGVEGSLVTFDDLAAKLSNVPGKVIVVIDSCFSGCAIAQGEASDEELKEFLESYNQSAIDAFAGYELESASNDDSDSKYGELRQSKFTVITAAAYNETSMGGYYISYFTGALLEGMGCDYDGNYEGSMDADANGDSLITLGEIYNYTHDAVIDEHTVQCYGTKSEVLFRRK